jgi:arginyl-tRNA synthetase
LNIPSVNPFGDFRSECELALREGLFKNFIVATPVALDHVLKEKIESSLLGIPSSSDFGDLASSVCFEIAKKLNVAPQRLADDIIGNINLSKTYLVKSVKAIGGYINFYADDPQLSQLTLESIRLLGKSYGYVATSSPLRIIVEHTSVNPVGPIHVGTARNSILGDSLSRLLKARGHTVVTHFYVDDVGRQIAVLAYGYDMLKRPRPTGKVDHWIGLVYAITSCIIEIERLKRKLKELVGNDASLEQANKTRLDLDSWIAAAADLQ